MHSTLNIVLSGEAGQGLQTIEDFLVQAISPKYYVFSTKEVMSRVRGGNNSVLIRISDKPIMAYAETIDILYLLNNHSFDRMEKRITNETTLFTTIDFLPDHAHDSYENQIEVLDLTNIASQSGSVLFANTVLFGHVAGMLALDVVTCHNLIKDRFGDKSEKIQLGNIKAFDEGYQLGLTYRHLSTIKERDQAPKYLLTGTEAVGVGALAGGCNFIASYPMSPATGVLIYLSSKSNDFEVFVEQAEDEIAALNMTLGAWYAGARALATTSGGGFALMEEAVSLSGITETPCVIHIAQRPGPGTGLPTRTGQEDLNLAVYSGHGEFNRIVLAPGNIPDAIKLSQKAFWLADKYQIPVFILTDQYLLDSVYQYDHVTLDPKYLESFVVESREDYKRYLVTENGISPRAIPGYGKGLVKCDSDEHTEDGMITEDFEVRVVQNDKRLSRLGLILDDYEAAELIGNPDYETLLVGWGSTFGVINEFVHNHEGDKVAYLYIKQPYPLSPDLKAYFNQASKIISVENNATGQLANLLKLHLDVKVSKQLLKYNGVPFAIEDLDNFMKEEL